MNRDKEQMYELNSLLFSADEKVYSALRFAQKMDKRNIIDRDYFTACDQLSAASHHISNAYNLINNLIGREE